MKLLSITTQDYKQSMGLVLQASIGFCLALLVSIAQVDSAQAAPWSPKPGGNWGGGSWTKDTTAPTTPGNLRATATSSSGIKVEWKTSFDKSGVKTYTVFRGGSKIAEVSGTSAAPSFSDSGLSASTPYTYYVTAKDAAGNTSGASNSASATTPAAGAETPSEPPSESPSSEVVGFLGCSMTMDAVDGAIASGSYDFWDTLPNYSSGGVYQWASNLNSSYWDEFQAAQDAQPTTTVWWQLCALNTTANYETYENALIVLNEIKRRIPGATVYVSAQPSYNPSSHTCKIAGSTGPTRMASLANQLIKNGVAFAGPTISPLAYPSQTLTDGCHGNTAGEEAMGQDIIDFFTGL